MTSYSRACGTDADRCAQEFCCTCPHVPTLNELADVFRDGPVTRSGPQTTTGTSGPPEAGRKPYSDPDLTDWNI